jgi:hypothetical protein
MSRKPIEKEIVAPLARKALVSRDRGIGQASGQKLLSPRERMWAAMIKLTNKSKARTFTASEVIDLAHPCEFKTVGDYLAALQKAGLVELVSEQGRKDDGDFSSRHWRLLVNWAQAPRINKAGTVVTQGLGVLAMWRAARIRREFSPAELAQDASVGEIKVSLDTARQYCFALAKSGHFAFVVKGTRAEASRLRLVKDTGPLAPAITKAKVVFDRNQARHIVVDTPQETCDQLG